MYLLVISICVCVFVYDIYISIYIANLGLFCYMFASLQVYKDISSYFARVFYYLMLDLHEFKILRRRRFCFSLKIYCLICLI